jgi:DNA-binding NtrC family response regulator
MTAHGSAETAVLVMKEGAVDYLTKPFSLDDFRLRVRRVVERRTLSRRLDVHEGFAGMVARSPRMLALVADAQRVATTDETVLILGESGTGKTRLARAIHHVSARSAAPFVEVHCAALPETLIESELFGREKGAFTGATESKGGHIEAAQGGTLFLDEIAEIPPPMQVKLLRFLQDRAFTRLGSTQPRKGDVRLIAATSRKLDEAVASGSFREDLYYRLNVFPLLVPPLRDRPEDVRAIAGEALARRGLGADRLTADAVTALERHAWPGNVRELENVLARAIILAGAHEITPAELPAAIARPADGGPSQDALDALLVPGFSLDALERDLIHHALEKAGGNKAAAARLLGITRRRLYSRLVSLEKDESDED